jgi:hypothetical protein
MNPEDVDVVPTPIEQVEPGMSLMIKHEGHAVLFQVENKKFSHKPGTGTVWTLESEPVEGGKPLVIQGPSGTIVHRIVRKT